MSSRSRENKLIPVRCEKVGGEKPGIVLLGLINFTKTVKGSEGWLLMISGNPFVRHSKGLSQKNKMGIHNLYLNDSQKEMLYKSSLVKDGYVYLYTCSFNLGDCQMSSKCQERHSQPLLYLAEFLKNKSVSFDVEYIVPLKVTHLRTIVLKKGNELGSGLNDKKKLRKEIFEDKAIFKFRTAGNKIFVDFECPGNHPEYRVELLFLQTLIYKNSGAALTRTNILEEDELFVKQSSSEKIFPVTRTLRVFQLPDNEFGRNEMPQMKGNVKDVEFWVKAYLNRLDNSCPKRGQNGGGGIYQREVRAKMEATPMWKKYLNFWKPKVEEECEECVLSTRLVVMEIELDALEEEVEDE